MPLVTPGGAPIGAVCVLDQKPRQLTSEQREAMASLARLTMNLMEARHRELELQRANFLDQQIAEPAPVQPSAPDARLHAALEARLRPGSGYSVNHATASPKLIVVLHGNDTDDALAA